MVRNVNVLIGQGNRQHRLLKYKRILYDREDILFLEPIVAWIHIRQTPKLGWWKSVYNREERLLETMQDSFVVASVLHGKSTQKSPEFAAQT
jgi:hypothetical protein